MLSVIIPTHNPVARRFERTLAGLKAQTLDRRLWELLIVDNATPDAEHVASFDTSWHPNARIIREEKLGLTAARLAGIKASRGEYLVFVDDDNVLSENYIKSVLEIFDSNEKLGAVGGKSLPEFEIEIEPWITQFFTCLALRDLGETPRVSYYDETAPESKQYPSIAPLGAGMALRRAAAEFYAASVSGDSARLSLDRTGRSLTSGGDNDIVLTVWGAGWGVGYFPQLELLHLIPAGRLSKDYLARLNHAMSRSWIQVLDVHGIRQWRKIPRWTVWPRKMKAFLIYQAWKDPASYVRWQGACGMFEGQASLPE